MRPRQAAAIAAKVDELRAVFVLGQRALPFFEEVLTFLREISPLIEDINSSLQEHFLQLPQATSKLRSVTEATELATAEVLDLVDRALAGVAVLRAHAARTQLRARGIGQLDARMIRLVRQALADRPKALQEVDRIHREKAALRRALESDSEEPVLDDVRDHMGRIMISLQVQDITAQQIAGVHHLLESVRSRMARLAHELEVEGLGPEQGPAPHGPDGPVAFDPDATYDPAGDHQQRADVFTAAAFSAPAVNPLPMPETPSQADIDALFRSAASAAPSVGDGAPAPAAVPAPAPATRSDIDAPLGAQPAAPAA